VWVDDNGVLGSVRVVRDFEEGRRMKTMIQIIVLAKNSAAASQFYEVASG